MFVSRMEDLQVYSGKEWLKAQGINIGSEIASRYVPAVMVPVTVYKTTNSLILAVTVEGMTLFVSGLAQDKLIAIIKDQFLVKDSDKKG